MLNLPPCEKCENFVRFRRINVPRSERNCWWCALPEVDEEQGWEEALADEGAAPEGGCSAVGGVGGEFVEFPRISPACFSTWYMASTSAHTG